MYLALYRKYRPRTFRDVISQEHITRTLQNQLQTGQLAHAYLFTGTRGTGKTTCAKILAMAVNCEHPVDGNPCLECESCKKIAEGSTDIVEMDAASNNSVDDVRQLRDEIVYTPIDVKYKVYIIDEVHMLSPSAFNALLKTIEEPPSHIIFILATTDVHKVPATILSRCQRYQFRKIDPKDSAERLAEVAKQENALLHYDAAALLTRLADGAMRDALSLLDQCISASNEVTLQVVKDCCGVAGSDALFAISVAAAVNDSAAALKTVDELIRNSKDMTRFIDELTVHYRNLMLLKVTPDSDLVAMLPEEKSLYSQQLEQYSLPMIMRCLDILTGCLDDINRMKQTSQLRIMVEMVMLRLCTPKLDTDQQALSMRIDELERRLDRGEFTAAQTPAAKASQPKAETAPAPKPQPEVKAERKPSPPPQPAAEQAAPWEDAPVQADFVDDTGFAMPPQPAAEQAAPWENAPAQADFADDTGFAMPPQPAAEQPAPWENAPTQADFVDDTGFAMPPKPAAEQPAPWENAPVQADFVDDTGFAMPPQSATEQAAPWENAPVQADFADDTGFAMPPPSATESEPEKADKPKQPLPSHGTKQPVATSGIKPSELEKEQPVAEWVDIIGSLPPMIRAMLSSSRAYHHDGLIAIVAGTAARTILLDGTKADSLRDAASKVLGREIPLVLAAEETVVRNKDEKLNEFLERVSQTGIPIKTKKTSK